jgi:hypothetical protein
MREGDGIEVIAIHHSPLQSADAENLAREIGRACGVDVEGPAEWLSTSPARPEGAPMARSADGTSLPVRELAVARSFDDDAPFDLMLTMSWTPVR